ncbi:MAG: glycoside hydrolase family 5 protein [Ignavibacteriae bacterium]|nr:glycoside hydrolase family 5 protein [Ignavibacteriota bacterium]
MSSSFEQNKKIGKGINIGNALEAPHEGDWGLTIEKEYFTIIKKAGFSSVRIPIKWSAHSEKIFPFTISELFFSRIDLVIQQALDTKLIVILNVHHFNELFRNPRKYKKKYFAMWKQISERYKNYSSNLFFELLNEPSFRLTPKKWNLFLNEAISIVRTCNPNRIMLVGPARWNNVEGLKKLKLPQASENLIVTFHYYKPFHFTHQGAEWVWFSNLFLGTKWTSTIKQKNKIDKHFKYVSDWALKNKVPINLGEFGAYNKADLGSRVLWTNHVARTAEKYNFSFIYWEFGYGFGAYDIKNKKWNVILLFSIIPKVQTGLSDV